MKYAQESPMQLQRNGSVERGTWLVPEAAQTCGSHIHLLCLDSSIFAETQSELLRA